MPARRRGGGAAASSTGGTFRPTKANLYAAVKAIFHPETNSGVAADDAHNELDVSGVGTGDGRARLTQRYSARIDLTNTNLTRSQHSQAVLTSNVADGEVWVLHVTTAGVRFPLGQFLAADLEALTASNGNAPSDSNAIPFPVGDGELIYLSKTSDRHPLYAATNADYDANPLTISRLDAPAGPPGTYTGPDEASAAEVAGRSGTDYVSARRLPAAYALPAAAEGTRGGVRGATSAQATAAAGTTILGWSLNRIRQAIQTLVPAVFRAGNTDRIPVAKLGTGDPAANTALFGDGAWKTFNQGIRLDALTIKYQNAQQATVAGIAIGDMITVGGDTAALLYAWVDEDARTLNMFFAHGGLSLPSGNPSVSVDGTTIANLVDADRQAVRSNVDTDGEWWWTGNLPASQALLSELDDVILNIAPSDWEDFAGAVPDSKIPAGIARDSEVADSVTGLTLDGATSVLTGTRRSGANPIEVNFSALAGGAAGASENPDETTIACDTSTRFQGQDRLNPDGYRSGQTVATPTKIGLLTAGSSLSAYASALSEADDTVTLEAGLYIVTFAIAVYSGSSAGTPEAANARYNTHHEARTEVGGVSQKISTDLSNAYVRPIGSGTDQQYGGYRRAIIMRVPAKGPVEFLHALTGQATTGYLGCRQIVIYRIAGPARTVDTRPSVSSFSLAGDLAPAAGAINETYTAAWTVAQSSHLSALRIVRFSGTAAAPAAVTVLATIAAADWHGGSQEITVSGFNLAADATETVRIEGYGEGQTPATDQPVTYHDVRITAHATTAATRFIRVRDRIGGAPPPAANIIANATVIATAGTVIGDWTVAGIPNDNEDWLVGWIVAQSGAQPNHYTIGGISNDAGIAARFALTENGVDYWVYLATDDASADDSFNGTTITVT
ncbi:MAG: hypothetical protein OXQ28_00290 [Acidobacteriota bacterium]|nr:hypothetical protein [Acidobacteriota bacterium]